MAPSVRSFPFVSVSRSTWRGGEFVEAVEAILVLQPEERIAIRC